MKQLADFIKSAPQPVAQGFAPVRFDAGAHILWEGEENRWVYLLLEGSAEGYLQSAQGGVSSVFYYRPVSLFGEFEVFSPGGNIINVAALSPCRLLRLSGALFLEWIKSDFEFNCHVIRQIVEKTAQNAIALDCFSHSTAREKVLRCAAAWHSGGRLSRLTKETLCAETNLPLRSLNRALAACAEEGVLRYEKKHFRVLDEQRLLAYLPR